MTASIEFAVGALKVPNIVVCGHSECGAMKGAMDLDGLRDYPHVREWLAYARAAVLISNRKGADLDEKERLNLVIKENVLLQMAHLKTHPYVAAMLSAGETKLHAWVYDIKTGEVLAFDEAANDFITVAEHYKDGGPGLISSAIRNA